MKRTKGAWGGITSLLLEGINCFSLSLLIRNVKTLSQASFACCCYSNSESVTAQRHCMFINYSSLTASSTAGTRVCVCVIGQACWAGHTHTRANVSNDTFSITAALDCHYKTCMRLCRSLQLTHTRYSVMRDSRITAGVELNHKHIVLHLGPWDSNPQH